MVARTGSPRPVGCRPGCVGCGIGTDERAQDELRAVLGSSVPVVLDADALTLLGDGAAAPPGCATGTRRPWSPRTTASSPGSPASRSGRTGWRPPAGSPRGSAWSCCSRATVRSWRRPDGTAWANPTGTPALATAGTGDVLAGLLVSLLAAGLPADRAAVAAAFVHGLAGRQAGGAVWRGGASAGDRPGRGGGAARGDPLAVDRTLGLTGDRDPRRWLPAS